MQGKHDKLSLESGQHVYSETFAGKKKVRVNSKLWPTVFVVSETEESEKHAELFSSFINSYKFAVKY